MPSGSGSGGEGGGELRGDSADDAPAELSKGRVSGS
jgi:hypothetical protein